RLMAAAAFGRLRGPSGWKAIDRIAVRAHHMSCLKAHAGSVPIRQLMLCLYQRAASATASCSVPRAHRGLSALAKVVGRKRDVPLIQIK
ncbi:MAG: hypothetical protein KGO02_00365, partial [Alphaproteobacteria bacterium]|nr:hypothetical protein [Alphaproteobacteria bacterium]